MIEHDLTPRKEVAKQHPDADKVHMSRKIVAIVKTTTVVSILISSSRPSGDSWMYPYQRNPYIISPIWWVFINLCYNPQESLENTINTMGTLLGYTPLPLESTSLTGTFYIGPIRVVFCGFPRYVPRKDNHTRIYKNIFRDGQTGCVNFGDFYSEPQQSL